MLRKRLEADKHNLSIPSAATPSDTKWHEDLARSVHVISQRHFDDSTILRRSRLQRNIKLNSRDPVAWRDFLTFLNDERKRAARADPSSAPSMHQALVKLYIIATNVVPMSAYNRHSEDYLALWLDLAALRADSPEDSYLARDVFKSLKTNSIGQRLPSFWLAYAHFEQTSGNSEKAARFREKAAACSEVDVPPAKPLLRPNIRTARPPLRTLPASSTPSASHPIPATPPLAKSTSISPEAMRRAAAPSFEPPQLLSPPTQTPDPAPIASRLAMPAPTMRSRPRASPLVPASSASQIRQQPMYKRPNNDSHVPTTTRRTPRPASPEQDRRPMSDIATSVATATSAEASSRDSSIDGPLSRGSRSVSRRDRDHRMDRNENVRNMTPPVPWLNADNVATVNGTQYLVLGVVGKGGSSKVYKVLGPDFQVFALKRVRVPSSASNFKATFDSYANEIDLLQRLRGKPNIVTCFDAEVREDMGMIQLIMEHGEQDLAKQLSERKNRRDCNALRIQKVLWTQMLEAVHTIHQAKIVHGDLKPANFLCVTGKLKLIDFGIAKAIMAEDTTKIFRDVPVGTPNYMSPEALVAYDGDDENFDMDVSAEYDGMDREMRPKKYRVGRASDIWSLGCILYQMVYGRTPFAHLTNIMQKLSCIQDPSYEIQYGTVEDTAVLEVLQGCLQRDPAKRMSIPELLNHRFLTQCAGSMRGGKSEVGREGGDLTENGLHAVLRQVVSYDIPLEKLKDMVCGRDENRYQAFLRDMQRRLGGDSREQKGEMEVMDRIGSRDGSQRFMTPTSSGLTNQATRSNGPR